MKDTEYYDYNLDNPSLPLEEEIIIPQPLILCSFLFSVFIGISLCFFIL